MSATSANADDTLLPLTLPAVQRNKVTLAFDGGRLSSGAGVPLLREAERRPGLAERLGACMNDRRDAARIDPGGKAAWSEHVVLHFQRMVEGALAG